MADQIEIIGASMTALAESLRATAHNIANVDTTGYKRLHGLFAQTLGAEMGDPAEAAPALDFTQGGLVRTGRPLDLALTGKGFFVIETPQGELYTRNGTFSLNAAGQMVDTSGRVVAGADGPIMIPTDAGALAVEVTTEGRVRAAGQEVGRLRLVEFEDASVLRPVGASCFGRATPVEPTVAADASVRQGYLEGSNVSAIKELVSLITITRLYEANVKTVESMDEGMRQLLAVAMGS
jgi:flagellar basal body rod protein FlgG